jgi:hypothetical protein
MMHSRRLALLCLTCLLALGAFAGFSGAASAAAANDNFADAELVKGSAFGDGSSLIDATREDSEPVISGSDTDHTVWFRWVAPATGFMRVTACGDNVVGSTDLANSALGIYTGSSVSTLTPLAQVTGNCANGKVFTQTSPVAVVAGTSYYVQYGHASADAGDDVDVYFDFSSALSPNDDWDEPTVLPSSLPQSIVGSTDLATGNNEVALASGYSGRNSVWYSWTPAESGMVSIDTCSSALTDIDTVLQVFDDGGNDPVALDTLNSFATDDDGCDSNGNLSFLTAEVTAGEQYWIRVSNYYDPFGLDITLRLRSVGPLENIALPTLTLYNPDVGTEIGRYNGNWYGPDLDAIDYFYQWQRCDAAGANCIDIDGAASSDYEATSDDLGHSIRVAVTADDGDNSVTAYSDATFEIGASALNDFILDAIDVGSGAQFSQRYINRNADTEGNETDLIAQTTNSTVWFKWTAPATGASSVGTCRGSDAAFDHPIYATVGVYTGYDGISVDSVTPVASASDNCGVGDHGASVQFNATAGTTYWLQVGSANQPQGQFALKISGVAAAGGTGNPPVVVPPVDPFPATAIGKLGNLKQKKGKVTLSKLNLTCGATATGPCTGTLKFKTAKKKVGGKTIKSVSQTFKLSVKPGTKVGKTYKLNKKLLAAIKKAKSLKTTVTVKLGAPGFSQKTASTSATLKN